MDEKILELRQKRKKAWEDAKNFLTTHEKNGVLSGEDTATYEKFENEVTELGKQIDRLERQKSIDDELNKAVNDPIKTEAADLHISVSGRGAFCKPMKVD